MRVLKSNELRYEQLGAKCAPDYFGVAAATDVGYLVEGVLGVGRKSKR